MRARFNQKLYFSRLLLQQAEGAAGALRRSLLEASTMQLTVAYRSHLADLATSYRQQLAPGETAAALAVRLRNHDLHIAELDRLAELERGGWLGQLLRLADAVMAIDVQPPVTSSGAGEQMIAAVEVDVRADDLLDRENAVATLGGWQRELEEAVALHAQHLQEW